MKRIVVIESPYRGPNEIETETNLLYAQDAIRDSLLRGEAPFASHVLYTKSLSDHVPDARILGMDAGWAFYEVADLCVVYTDRGISDGMRQGVDRAQWHGVRVEFRSLGAAWVIPTDMFS